MELIGIFLPKSILIKCWITVDIIFQTNYIMNKYRVDQLKRI